MKSLVALLSLLIALPNPLLARCKCFGSLKKSEPTKQVVEEVAQSLQSIGGDSAKGAGFVASTDSKAPDMPAPMVLPQLPVQPVPNNSLSEETTTIKDLETKHVDHEKISTMPRNPELFVFGPTLEHSKVKPKKNTDAFVKHLHDFFHYFCAASGAAMLGILFLSHKYADRINNVKDRWPRHEPVRPADAQPQAAAPVPPVNPGVPPQVPPVQPQIVQPIVQPVAGQPVAPQAPIVQPAIGQAQGPAQPVAPVQNPAPAPQGAPQPVLAVPIAAPQEQSAEVRQLQAEVDVLKKQFAKALEDQQQQLLHQRHHQNIADAQAQEVRRLAERIDARQNNVQHTDFGQAKPHVRSDGEYPRRSPGHVPNERDHKHAAAESPLPDVPSPAPDLPPSSAAATATPTQNATEPAAQGPKVTVEDEGPQGNGVRGALDFDNPGPGFHESDAEAIEDIAGSVAPRSRLIKPKFNESGEESLRATRSNEKLENRDRDIHATLASVEGPAAEVLASAEKRQRSPSVDAERDIKALDADKSPNGVSSLPVDVPNSRLSDIAEDARNGNHSHSADAPAPGAAADGPR